MQMKPTAVLVVLSALATGALAGCDKDTPVTEVPAAIDLPLESDAVAQEDPEPRVAAQPAQAETESPESRDPASTVESAAVLATDTSPVVDEVPAEAAKPRQRKKVRKRRRRPQASKAEAKCGEGTCA